MEKYREKTLQQVDQAQIVGKYYRDNLVGVTINKMHLTAINVICKLFLRLFPARKRSQTNIFRTTLWSSQSRKYDLSPIIYF